MVSLTGKSRKLRKGERPSTISDTDCSSIDIETTHVGPTNRGAKCIDAGEHRRNLEERLQSQLKDRTRSTDVKRLNDPLVRHLIRVAGNTSYRDLRQSVIVSGKTLICELLTRFHCRRLALRRQVLPVLRSYISHAHSSTYSQASSVRAPLLERHIVAPGDAHYDLSRPSAFLNVDVETHYVSNRILRKVAGFHSYDDGCIAEMRMPNPASDMGNIRLLLCLGRLPSAFGRPSCEKAALSSRSAPESVETGAIGTLLRTAAALQWQGAWILPSCPDIFCPLSIRASQGALFWLPYRRGGVDELAQFCRAKDLAICVPRADGIPVRTAGLFEDRKKKGVCLVVDSAFMSAAGRTSVKPGGQQPQTSFCNSGVVSEPASCETTQERPGLEPDMFLSLGSDVAPEGSMQLLHPITVASLLLYQTKQAHFASLRGSPHVFSVKQKL